MAAVIDPYITQQLQSRRRTATTQYGLANAQLQLQRSQLGTSYNQTVRDQALAYQKARTKLPGQFAQRRLLNSGIYQNALTELRRTDQDAIARHALAYQNQLAQFGLQGQQNELTYRDELANLAGEEQALRTQAILRSIYGVL